MKIAKNSEDNESQTLLNDKKASYSNDNNRRHRSSRLEWIESSWTRILQLLSWWWMNPILYTAYRRQLTVDDLDNLPHIDKASVLLDRLSSYDWSSNTWSIVCKEFWKDYIVASLFLIPFLITSIAPPLLFRQIILNMMNEQGSNSIHYLYAILLFLSVTIQTLIQQHTFFRFARIGLRIFNALTMIIYKHALSLKLASLQEMKTGQIMNLIINDAPKFQEVCSYLGLLVEGLIELIVIFGLLCWIMHPIPTVCSYALFPLFVLLQFYLSQKFGQYYEITAMCVDKRIQAFTEFIHGCHIVKMYNWEKALEDRIVELRKHELASIRRTYRFRAINMTLYFTAVSFFTLTMFGSAWLLGYPLNTENVLPTLSLFSVIRVKPLYYIPLGIEKLSAAKYASRRIDSFMRLNMKQENQFQLSNSSINEKQKGNIMISSASFSWFNEMPCLSLSDLIIEQGTFVAIVGPVGSGKSSLLAAVLGEMNLINGQLNTNRSSFAYVAESPWIFEDTLRNNILLNRPFDQQRYRNIIHACCLDVDINTFGSSGDLIMIGENGINLSGGQKARVSLARALYADMDIYLIDDPFAAVDYTVAEQIYERCIGPSGLLKSKTRLLVTHQTQFLSESHQIIFLSHGHIDKQGCLNEKMIREKYTNKKKTSILANMLDDNISIDDPQPIINDETPLNEGNKWSIWYHLFTAPPFGRIGFCLLIVLLLLGELLYDGTNYCLSVHLRPSDADQRISPKFVYIYFGLTIAMAIVDIIRKNYYFSVVLYGAKSLHNKMLRGLLYASIQFFESNPSGRIINRASKDQYVIDELLPIAVLEGIEGLLLTVGSLFIICLTNISLFLVLIILIPVGWLIIYCFQRCSVRFKRLESITRSPVYALFSSSLHGLSTIHSFNAENSFIQLMADKIDTHTSAYLAVQASSELFSTLFGFTCLIILLVTSIGIVQLPNHKKLSTATLSLVYAMHVTSWIQWTIRKLLEAHLMMVSGERIDEYSRLPHEEDKGGHKGLVKTSSKWPTHGKVEFRNYSLRHRFNLEYVIRNIDLHIESHQKIGIIGRTGAGKSSLFKGIFRFVNRSCVDGEILIDGIDISRVTLNHLRSHISVIPQQPILFSGTIRYNLDPFNHYSDEQCWMALEDVQLKQFVSNQPAGLLMYIAEWDKSLSIGQCQLLCIARAILKKSKILLIDEATAHVDQETDDLVHAIIRNKFQDRTVLTIAHRLNTVVKLDRVLVLDRGKIVNFDSPTNILERYN
ncbi:unnamed protein product [Rotaria sp. Silwood2]|nr:unnamed protein product [Rotaria sp. Silwood2]CAF2667529.1 unnamed protein product [Rotaria sp. Silwood2]CAF2919950.1 unnamed protein product [Rotaria sp. Silwood2]CAF3076750.1 unnamed protein product [Rotaria sp. Silwood2]CAF4000665.1 unnamed protein product [Rotaria sp. Silwood2]